MSDRQRITENEKNISENKSDISRICGILNDGLLARVVRIENRVWTLIIGLVFVLLTVLAEFIYLVIRFSMEKGL